MPRIKIKTSGICKTPKALNTVFQGVVRINNKVNDTEVLTRNNRKSTVLTPVLVMTSPSGKCRSGGPGVMNKAGKMINPVKNGSANHTLLMRKLAGMADAHAKIKTNK